VQQTDHEERLRFSSQRVIQGSGVAKASLRGSVAGTGQTDKGKSKERKWELQ